MRSMALQALPFSIDVKIGVAVTMAKSGFDCPPYKTIGVHFQNQAPPGKNGMDVKVLLTEAF